MEYVETIQPYLYSAAPFAIALVCSSIITIFNPQKFIQCANFLLCFAIAIKFLLSNSVKETTEIIILLGALNDATKLALSFVIISLVYFGGSFYMTVGAVPKSVIATPASCDSSVDFDVPASLPENDAKLFEYTFDKLKKEIIEDLPTIYEMPDEAVKWVDRMITYNVAGGKMNRGLSCVAVAKTIAESNNRKLSNKERLQSAALGWCVEFLQAFFLVADDAMDDSVTRRGQPCWFRLPEVKLIAINDSFILESCVFKILKKYFGAEPCYTQLLDLFIEVTRQTEFGQLLDLTSQPQGGVIDLSRFTIQRYNSIVRYKTAFYSFYLPVALGLIQAGVTERKHFEKAREILLIMGEYFQVQDDYLDCYGSPEVIGKIGTDIQDNKCSWLVVQALNIVTPEQKKILIENYGKHDMKKVEKVKKLYLDLNIERIFQEYEEKSYVEIKSLLAQVKDMPIEIFEFLLKKIYKRSK